MVQKLHFSAIAQFFKYKETFMVKAESSVEARSGPHERIDYDPEVLLIVKGEVHAGMRDRIYKVEIFLNNDKNITDAECTCPRGLWLCHHMTAVALFAHYNISVRVRTCQRCYAAIEIQAAVSVDALKPSICTRSSSPC